MKTRSKPRIEKLESRTLLSAWSTVDSIPGSVKAIAADASGDVFAVGETSQSGPVIDSLREKPAAGPSWRTVATVPGIAGGVAADASGDVFVTGYSSDNSHWLTWELPEGSTSFTQLDDGGPSASFAVAIDAAGNLYTVGRQTVTVPVGNNKSASEIEWTVRKGTYNPSTGAWAFSTVDQLGTTSGLSTARGVTVVTTTINGVPSTGIYVVGNVGSNWVVRKSASGNASTWTTVDSFRYNSTGNANSVAYGVAGDRSGDLYVGGFGVTETFIGYVKGRATYSSATHWIVRKSSNAGASWSTNDDFLPQSSQFAEAEAVGSDLVGNMYVVGQTNGAFVRTNKGGSWTTVDDYAFASYHAFAADAFGNLYAGGSDSSGWLIRSQPAAPTNLTATPEATSSSSQIDLSWTNAAASDETGFEVYRSTDGINFTAVASVGASATTFSDTGLAPATTYFYYVIALLNATGASAPSNTASAST